MTGSLPSNTVKNLKLNVNPTSLVLSAHSYLMEDLQSSSRPLNSINAIKSCSKQTNNSQKYQPQVKTLTVNEVGTPKPKEPEQTLEDEFKDLHLNLPVLEVLAHAPIYNAILDKYVESLELGKNRSIFGVKEINLGDEHVPYWTTQGKRESYEPRPSTDGIGARPPYYTKKDFMDYHLSREWEIARDAELNPFKDVLVFRKMIEFLGVVPINLKGNIWESEELIEKRID
ncbi:hypothetical protein Tco_0199114 [Tanacetum coccineum]